MRTNKYRLSFLSRLHTYLQWRKRTMCAAIFAALLPIFAHANPNGAQVISGQVTIDQSVAGVTTVTNSPSAIINWQNFNIAQNEITRFIQQNGQSAVLNRIVGGNPSEILGSMFSNGQVFLINPNGIIFGAGSQIDTQGLLASTLNLSNSDFQKGNFHFIAGSKTGDITNEGIIHAGKDGNIVLIAPNIENKGIIHSEGGKIVLAAGQELILTSMDNPEIRFQVQAPKNHVLNVGQLLTEGGAINVFAGTLKHSGDISADSVEVDKQGNIRLIAKSKIELDETSKTSANNSKGDAGEIHIESLENKTQVQGVVEAIAKTTGQGGDVKILGNDVAILDNTKLNTSGQNGGGQILIGGDYQGKNPDIQNAQTTTIAENVEIKADAKTEGKGGKVIVWADENTKVAATISAKGGRKSGDGGLVETSGHKLNVKGTKVDTSAPKGKTGDWLLDPYNVTIAASGASGTSFASTFTAAATSTILASDIQTALGGSNVIITTTTIPGGDAGDIIVNAPISWASDTTLKLFAYRNIDINASITNTSTGTTNTKLALEYGQGAAALNNTATYNVRAPINLPAGQNFTTLLGDPNTQDYVETAYNVITSLGFEGDESNSVCGSSLQGQGCSDALGGNFALGANIDATATSTWNETAPSSGVFQGFAPIGGTFTGKFDGLGHTISGLTINRTNTGLVGLFSATSTSSVISNIGLLGGSITGGGGVGALVGDNHGNISNSYATANVTGINSDVGGLVGAHAYNTQSGIISNSYATGNVSGTFKVGGLVGYSEGAINNSYATGNVTGTACCANGGVGGLLGTNNTVNGRVSYSYATGNVTGGDGGLVGQQWGTVTNSFWDKTVNSTLADDGSGKTTAAMMTQSTFTNAGWDFTNTWWMSNTNTRPFLRSEWSTNITNAHQLQLMSSNLAANYTLANNLDLSSELSSASGMWSTSGFVPIGDVTTKFTGNFDGLNHTISNLTIYRPTAEYVGLFGYASSGSSIKNVGLVGGSVSGWTYVGDLVGVNAGTLINNSSTGLVSGIDYYFDSSSHSSGYVGGLVGWNNSGIVSNSSSTVAVLGNTYVGGLIGYNSFGTLSNNYSRGTVSGSSVVGGLVGYNAGTLSNSYSTGAVSGSSNVGGLIGYNNSGAGTISNSFWDTQTSGKSTSAGGTGLTTAQMQDRTNFTSWDFANTWTNGGLNGATPSYPHLLWQGLDQQTISGASALANKTLAYAVDGVSRGNVTTDGSGNFSVNSWVGTGNLLVWLSGETDKAATLTNGSYVTELKLELNTVYGQKDLDTTALAAAKGSLSDTDIPFSFNAATPAVLSPTVQTLKANNDVLINNSITTGGAAISIKAGKSVILNSSIDSKNVTNSTSGNIEIIANETSANGIANIHRDAGQAVIQMVADTNIDAGLGVGGVAILLRKRESDTPNNAGAITLYNVTGGDVNIDNAGTYNADDVGSGDVVLNGTLPAITANSLTVNTTGNVTQTAPITAMNLLLSNAGNITLTNNNVISTLAANGIGNLNFVNSAAFTIGSISSVNGINATGTVDISSYNGNLNVNQPVITTNASSDALKLNAGSIETTTTTGNILVGTSGSFSVGTNGIAKFFTGSISGTTLPANLIPVGNSRYHSDESISNYSTPITAAGKYAIYREQPTITVTAKPATKTYDGAAYSGGNGVDKAGFVNGDTDSILAGTLSYGGSSQGAINAGTYAITPAGLTNGLGYAIAFADGSLTINPAALVVNLSGSRVYDGTTTVNANVFTLSGLLSGENLVLSGAGTMANKNVGMAKAVSLDLVLANGTNGLASNYTLTGGTRVVDITPATLSISATGANKIYNSTTDAVVTLGDNRFAGDALTTSYGNAVFSDKNVGTKTINVTGITLTGADAENYTFNNTASTSAAITPASLNITATGANKIYNGTTEAIVTLGDNRFNGDALSTSYGNAVFADKNVGTKTITVSGITLTGADAGNYSFNNTASTSAAITPATLSISTTGANKIYNGTKDAVVTLGDNRFAGDALTTSYGNAVFSDKNVGTKTINVTGITLTGADAGNYSFNNAASTSAAITPATLSISATGANKIYNATTEAVVTLGDNRFAGDALTTSYGNAVFSDKNVGTKTINVTGITLTGADAGNYSFNNAASTSAAITPATLSISATGANKIYNGITDAVVTLGDNRFAGDALTTSYGNAVFSDKNVGTRTITVSDITLAGADAGNYSFNNTASTSAAITPATLSISATGANKIYNSITDAVVTLSDNRFAGDALATSYSNAVFADKNVGTKTITVSGITLAGAAAGNYTFNNTASTSAAITPASLSLTNLSAVNKVYDATPTATLSNATLAGILDADAVSLSAPLTGTFADKNVGTAKVVTVSGMTLTGTDANNYTLVAPASLTANITPASLAMTNLSAANKVYDATPTATLSNATLAGILNADDVNLSTPLTGTFADKNVGTAKGVTVSSMTLTGTDANNYTLVAPASLTANITPASLSIVNLSANNKVYDATPTATLSNATLAGILNADAVSLSTPLTGTFADKNVGTAKGVTVSSMTLTGTDANNYTLVAPANIKANITPASLSLTNLSATNKVYDATTTVTLSSATLAGILNADAVSLSNTLTGTFADKNVGTAKEVTVSSIVLTGADANNYTLVASTSLTANITPASLSIVNLSANNKVYDATTTATLSNATLVGILNADAVNLSTPLTGTFTDKNVGTAKGVTVSSITLTGTDANNYTLVTPASLTANITPASLSFLNLSTNNKVYDATTTATLSNATLAGILNADAVSLSNTLTGTFADKNVGTAKEVTVASMTLTGADANNYTLITPASLTANITPASLSLTNLSANNKVYDATTTATLSNATLAGILDADDVNLSNTLTGTFADKNVGVEKGVTVASMTLTGTDANNYTLVTPASLTANITPASLSFLNLSANNKVYDATTTATLNNATLAGILDADAVSLSAPLTGTFADKNVGTAKVVTVSGMTLTGTDANNYTLITPASLTANITPASLSLTNLSANNKVYDATTTATLSNATLAGILDADAVSLSAPLTGTFADKNVGTAKGVTVSSMTLTGTDANNYTLVAPANITANITPASLSLTNLSANNKVYDATTTATLSNATLAGILDADAVSLSNTLVGTFTDKNVGTAKGVTVSSITLTGTDASNYTLIAPASLTANITPASLSIVNLSANNKVYDATTTATLSNATLAGILDPDAVSLSASLTGTFADKNVGTAKVVTVSSMTLTGTDANNYTLVTPASLTANITPANLSLTNLSANNKVYDATTTATLSNATLAGILNADAVNLSTPLTGTFADKNVGTAKVVTVSGMTLMGTDANNYTLIAPASLTANITPASLSLTNLSAANKVYDATTTATLSNATLAGILNADDVNLSNTLTGTFTDKNVGTAKGVTVSSIALTGIDANNYTLVTPASLTATITPASLSMTNLSANNKVYDATPTATLSNATLVGILNADAVSLSNTLTGTFADKNVGTAKGVTVSSMTLTGTDANNYTLVAPTSLTANITPASLSMTNLSAANKVYDATPAATLSNATLAGILNADAVSLSNTLTGTFADKNVGTAKEVTVASMTLTGADANNYTLVTPASLTANITPASLSFLNLSTNNKVYDATPTATLSNATLTGILNADAVSLSNTLTGTFADKNVGTAKEVTVSSMTLTGADANNYTLVAPTSLTANITPASLSMTNLSAANKVYDATPAATLSNATLAGILNADAVNLSTPLTGTFADKNVGTAKVVTVSGITLMGADAGNYTLITPASLTANITPASLSLTNLSANNKVYDATTTATLSNATLAGILDADAVSLSASLTGTFADKNVGSAKVVTVSGMTLTGTDANNYTLIAPASLTANITPASLSLTNLSANNKVYDATTTATLSNATLAGILNADAVSLSNTLTGTFADKNVGVEKGVTISSLALTGADASNYTLIAPASLTANITPASLSIVNLSANNKVYDATTTATLSNATLAGILNADDVNLSNTLTGTFVDKNVGVAKVVTVSGITLTGADAANYTFNDNATTNADINRAIKIEWVSTLDKEWANGTNWDQGVVPDDTQDVNISNTGVLINISGTQSVNSLSSLNSLHLDDNSSMSIKNPFTLKNGTILNGNGTFNTATFTNEGTISPGNSPGKITIIGNYVQTEQGSIKFEIKGNSPDLYDQIIVTGSAKLGGKINVLTLDNFTPLNLGAFEFIKAGDITGNFKEIVGSSDLVTILPTLQLGHTESLPEVLPPPDTNGVPPEVLPPPDTNGVPSVVLPSPDTNSVPSVVLPPPDTNGVPPEVLPPPDTNGVPPEVLPPPDTNGVPSVVLPSPDTNSVPSVVLPPPDTNGVPPEVLPPPDTNGVPPEVLPPPDTNGVPPEVLPPPDTNGVPPEVLPSPDTNSVPSVVLPPPDTNGVPPEQAEVVKKEIDEQNKFMLTTMPMANPTAPFNRGMEPERIGGAGGMMGKPERNEGRARGDELASGKIDSPSAARNIGDEKNEKTEGGKGDNEKNEKDEKKPKKSEVMASSTGVNETRAAPTLQQCK